MDLDSLRADFVTVADDRKARQGWSDADVAELGAAVKTAIDAGAEVDLQAWGEFLSAEATALRESARVCREAEQRVRTQRAEERERAARMAG